MPEQITEKKSVQQEFLDSEKYAALKKEVADSMQSVDALETGESDRDIAPVFDYFEKEVVKNGFSEVWAEKLFWETVAEKIKEIRFKAIYRIIRPEIENADYLLARRMLMEELNKTIEQLSSTLYRNLSRRSVALTVLKEKFYNTFPEIESLIEETEEERRAKIKKPTGQLGKEDDEMPPPSDGEFREGFRDSYLIEERDWKVPDHKELVPGLTIIFWDKQTERIEEMGFRDIPRLGKDGDFFVKVIWRAVPGLINLATFGLMAYAQTGLWNSRYIPKRWEIKKENK